MTSTMASNYEEIEKEEFERGRMYERYKEKRDAKLREVWLLRMEQKQAEIRSIWHRLGDSRPSDYPLSPVRNTQKISKSIQEEKRAPVISRRNSFKKHDWDQDNTASVSSPSRPQSRKAINESSFISSPRNLSRSRTINTECKENRAIMSHHERRNTLPGPADFDALEIEKDFDCNLSSPRNGKVTKAFLKKGRGIGPGSGPAILKQRGSMRNEERDKEEDSSSSSEELLEGFSRQSLNCSVSSSSESVYSLTNNGVARVRERKKWVAPEKIEIFSNESEKDEVKGFKRLVLNIVGKSKHRDSLVSESRSFEVGR